MIIKLTQKYNLGGKEFEEFNLDLDQLTGKDLVQCEKEFKLRNRETAAVKELEDTWAVTVAAFALGVKYGDLLTLKAEDYLQVVGKTRLFLSKGWADQKPKTNSGTEVTGA
ncbi:hypothetical protein IX317_000643 [Fusobacterium sp. DD29]|uniref:hypothetical protein n=1 Tax=unclassified Fusobacterium TaxID=2648384 RepID=UPI001B8B1C2C|nr:MULTISPECIES: hypothetical protein [unclassified Fusobacterium]MBR8700235.1 hypothetical protein [Fusobacterium sp. DD45]MBR8710510.1 hypothetical protein [Fusobacterium sp. DD28]MBR8748982.1 hypothetical protein [Fusobacterium sp. DD29]MBR8751040.1 hypothetical protein [Fusobacterium sp. DD26]MBR8761288.1 hypothetical protein [Fusobacterium sp. DD25]